MKSVEKLIRKINLDIKSSNYDSVLKFINECKKYEELIILKEQKILFKIATKGKNRKVFSLYLKKIKEIDKLQYIYEKNYITFINFIISALDKITKRINIVSKLIDNDTIYTNLYRLGKYNDMNKLKAYEFLLDNIIYDEELASNTHESPNNKQKVILNLDKFAQEYTNKNFEYERLIALANSIILSKDYKISNGYYDDIIGKQNFDNFMELLQFYEKIYNIHDEICYGRYVIKNIVRQKIYLKFKNLEYEKTRITGQRRENVRRNLAKHNQINSEFISFYEEFIRYTVIGEKLFYEKNGIGYFEVTTEQIIDDVKTIINEEINYEDINLYRVDNDIVQASYLMLIMLMCQWNVISKLNLKTNDDFIKYYYPIDLDSVVKYIKHFGINVDINQIEDIFLGEFKKSNPYNIIYNPFIKLSNGEIFGINYLVERMDWSLFIRRKLINGGYISKKYGSNMEEVVEDTFIKYHWNIIERGYKLKVKKQIITDCDLITYKNGLLLIIQIKSSTKAKSPYDNWCVRNTIKKGVEQCKLCEKYFNLESEHISELLKKNNIDVEDIDHIQTLVVTPNYYFNGVSIEDVLVVNFGYLISLLNGAKIELMNENFEIIETKYPYLDSDWNSEQFINLLKKPFDWDLDLSGYKVDYKNINLNEFTIIKPVISEKTIKIN
ncbi:hypothetical protein [Clostridium thermobutyricum]|uniref:hypothetical protein n=1 Tax=Clostridium thermobutyricum TaxID=29372 RepID=UPI003F528CCF